MGKQLTADAERAESELTIESDAIVFLGAIEAKVARQRRRPGGIRRDELAKALDEVIGVLKRYMQAKGGR